MRQVTTQQWKAACSDYKEVINGQKYMMVLEDGATKLVPVEIKN